MAASRLAGSTNFGVSPAATQFVDGNWSCISRLLPNMEGNSQYNAMNFNYGYNDASGGNYTAASSVMNAFLCPSAPRANQRDTGDPSDTAASSFGRGYGYTDYGPTVYTDISPVLSTAGTGAGGATPFRDKTTRVNGLLKQGLTRIAECTDGTSNTIAIGEDAGRDERFMSPYTEANLSFSGGSGPYGPAQAMRYWRWAAPDCGFGVSGQPNNAFRPMNEVSPKALRRARAPCGEQRRASMTSHSHTTPMQRDPPAQDGGSVHFIKNSINLISLRGLVSLQGGEVLSADNY